MNAAEIARSMETDAVDFYTEAAEKTSHPIGKRMFLSIAEDEKRHIAMIEVLLKGLDITYDSIDPMEKVKSVFAEHKDEMQERLAATGDDKEALKIAMEMEKKGYDFYVKAASEATDGKSKALFERLVLEEQKHYKIFSNTYAFLDDTGNWFMWEEHSIVEG
jgi:rubrerythrin